MHYGKSFCSEKVFVEIMESMRHSKNVLRRRLRELSAQMVAQVLKREGYEEFHF